MSDKRITILVPIFNETPVLELFLEELNSELARIEDVQFSVLFIDDGSTDDTLKVLEELEGYKTFDITVVSLSRNFGKEIAIIAGIDHIDTNFVDAIIIMDVDLQDPPKHIKTFIGYWQKGYKDISATRVNRKNESKLISFFSIIFHSLLGYLSSIPIKKGASDFRLLDKDVVKALQQLRESERYSKGLFNWVGFSKKEIFIDKPKRQFGSTKWGIRKLFELALNGITSFSILPLRLSTLLGIIVSFVSFILMMQVLIRTFMYGPDVNGYPSLMVAIFFLGGVQLISLGIIGEYVGRIYRESKGRPLYFVDREYKKSQK